ncbi:MAG: hypothetical protein M5R42_16760 [Rhodocyclaceae bacterium]|nr:hypothetical protein [Rhodocyclaceae bacterium]
MRGAIRAAATPTRLPLLIRPRARETGAHGPRILIRPSRTRARRRRAQYRPDRHPLLGHTERSLGLYAGHRPLARPAGVPGWRQGARAQVPPRWRLARPAEFSTQAHRLPLRDLHQRRHRHRPSPRRDRRPRRLATIATPSASVSPARTNTPLPNGAAWSALVDRLRKEFPDARVTGHRDLSPDKDNDGLVEAVGMAQDLPRLRRAAWLRSDMVPPKTTCWRSRRDARRTHHPPAARHPRRRARRQPAPAGAIPASAGLKVRVRSYGKLRWWRARFANDKLAACFADSIAPGDIIVGHSNGVALAALICDMGAPVGGVVAIRALGADRPWAPQVPWVGRHRQQRRRLGHRQRAAARGHMWANLGRDGYVGPAVAHREPLHRRAPARPADTAGLPQVLGHTDFSRKRRSRPGGIGRESGSRTHRGAPRGFPSIMTDIYDRATERESNCARMR